MRSNYLAVLILFFVQLANAQDCRNYSSVAFFSQADVDQFTIDYPDCTEISVNLIIGNSQQSDIHDLTPLQNITTVSASLEIGNNPNLTNLNGLQNITSIGGGIEIINCENLLDISALSNVTNNQWLIIEGGNLPNLNGLQNINSIKRSLSLKGTGIQDLSALSNVTIDVEEILIEDNDQLVSLNGLQGIVSVSDNIFIRENDNLTTLQGLGSFSTTNNMIVANNPSLTNLMGLENLISVGDFYLEENENLLNLVGLTNLNSFDQMFVRFNNKLKNFVGFNSIVNMGDFFVVENLELENFVGLENVLTMQNFSLNNITEFLSGPTSFLGLNNLTTINEEFQVREVRRISSFEGLENLNRVRDLNFWGVELIDNLSGLENLSVISNELLIRFCHNLTSLEGTNLSSVNRINIQLNNNLSDCSINAICNHLVDGGIASIDSNSDRCNSTEEVLYNCDYVGRLSHIIFYDLNQNGLYDLNEPLQTEAYSTLQPDDIKLFSNSTNNGLTYLAFGNYSIEFSEASAPLWDLTTINSNYDFALSEQTRNDTFYVGLYPNTFFSDAQSSFAAPIFRCLTTITMDIFGENLGTNFLDGTLWLETDPAISNITFPNPPDVTNGENLFGWNFEMLAPYNTILEKIQFDAPFITVDSLTFRTFIEYRDDSGTFTSSDFTFTGPVECAYDPNDKLVSPVYPENYALIGEDLIFTIRFQNTGNAEAFDVIVRDTLDSDFDPTTFSVIGSSHSDVLSTTMSDNQFLKFDFHNIFLPDSTTNFEASQGYVMYRIKAAENISEETIVNNTAGIFFDFNPPIITNTTENKMVSTFDADNDGFLLWEDCNDDNPNIYPGADEIPNNQIDEDCDGSDFTTSVDQLLNDNFEIFPNPAQDYIKIQSSIAFDYQATLFDLSGRITKQEKNTNTIDLDDIASGIFFLEILDLDTGNLIVKKVIITN